MKMCQNRQDLHSFLSTLIVSSQPWKNCKSTLNHVKEVKETKLNLTMTLVGFETNLPFSLLVVLLPHLHENDTGLETTRL